MALYTGRILMRIGNEANYDIDKLMPGEWAVSTDKRIVRICVSAGIGIRMATYEAFEEDMAKIEEILNQCQTIQEAIVRINAEVSEKADAVAEYTEQARNYRDESRQYAESASYSASDAKKSETNASGSAEQAQNSAYSALTDAENAASSATKAGNFAGIAENSASAATEAAEQAQKSETNAKKSEGNAANSATNAQSSESKAKTSENNAKISESNAAISAEQAMDSKTDAEAAAEQARVNAINAASSAEQAKKSAISAASAKIKNSASGENIHLKDSDGSNLVEFALLGKAKQNTTTGKNIVKFKSGELTGRGVTITRTKESGKIVINGTLSSGILHLALIENIVPKVSGIYKLTGSSTNYCELLVRDQSTDEILNEDTSNNEVQCYLEAGKKYGINFLLSETTFNNEAIYPMLRLADTDDTFEPYTNGPSPNPEYPQEVEVSGASGSVVVKSCGKNYFNAQISSKTENDVTYTVNENKTIKVNGTASAKSGIDITIYLNKGRYIFSSCPSGGNTATYSSALQPFNLSGVIENTYWDFGQGIELNLTEDNTKIYCNIARIAQGYTANNLLFKPMIRKCDENGTPIGDDTYEPYKEIISPLPTPNGLVGIPSESGGNYTDENGQQWVCDEIVKYTDGTGEKIQRIKKVIYDGINMKFSAKSGSTTNNVFYSDSTTMDFKNPGNNALANVICTHFKRVMRNEGFDGDKPCIYGSTYPNIYIGFGADSTITTVALANEWLKSNNVTVYYELAEPIRTPLTAEEIAAFEEIQTFYPVTHITNDSECGMKVTYFADLKNYIDNQLALQAQAQEAAMINMLLLLPEETQATMIENDTNNLLTESEE